ncbi:MinD/ParA family protein [Pseudonocardia sp. ICBG601]|uniref:MinD/ParA family ATP-binding protein n=1 Tax=Pseudonocardia sp. ICBG601 TaxID=2846759 RepID=UPI001CF611A0|nr:MinD/ParA family protein [Pseudonocardia sp. ICBG601]
MSSNPFQRDWDNKETASSMPPTQAAQEESGAPDQIIQSPPTVTATTEPTTTTAPTSDSNETPPPLDESNNDQQGGVINIADPHRKRLNSSSHNIKEMSNETEFDNTVVGSPPPPPPPPPSPHPGSHQHGHQQPSSHTLNHDTLTKHRADIPQHGWRRATYRLTAGLINPGISPTEKARQQLRERVRRRLHAPHRVAVLSVKGGIGKTTLTACIGYAIAEIRGDQVAVIDANPDAGTLADRLTGDTSLTIRHLLNDIHTLNALTDVTSYMTLAGRLKVLSSDQDPATSEALTANEYTQVIQLLSKYFNLIITDCGTGISHDTMTPTLKMAHSLIITGSPTIDGASRAAHTLDWLNNHGYTHQANNAIVVLNHKDTSPDIDTHRITEHFQNRTRAVITLPHDPHLAAGGRINFHRLHPTTTHALTEISAHIADGFPTP